MTWQNILPNAPTAEASQAAADPLMDNDAFAGFYQRSARPLWAYLARASGDPALAEDLMQESFVRFLSAAPPTDGELACRRYLFRIATNLLRDHWRRSRSTSIDDLPEELFATADHSAHIQSQAILGPAMASIGPRARQILWLAYAEGYSHREIAQITGLATPGIRLLLFRARRKMATLLRDQNTQPTQPSASPEPASPEPRSTR